MARNEIDFITLFLKLHNYMELPWSPSKSFLLMAPKRPDGFIHFFAEWMVSFNGLWLVLFFYLLSGMDFDVGSNAFRNWLVSEVVKNLYVLFIFFWAYSSIFIIANTIDKDMHIVIVMMTLFTMLQFWNIVKIDINVIIANE